MAALPDMARKILDNPEFAVLSTIEPDGQPQSSVVWFERDGDDLLMSTVKGRRKHRNLEQDPRATVLVYPKVNPYSYVELRGSVAMSEEGGRELIDRLCRAYTGAEHYAGDGPDDVRVVVRLTPSKVVTLG